MSASSRLSSADAAWLRMDRPNNLMVINSVLRLPERLGREALLDVLRERLLAPYPRFSQRVEERPALLGGPRWVPARGFELERHVHRLGLPEPGDEAALEALVGDLASTPLDRSKPLWEMYLVDGPGRGSSLIVRMHHCIADGILLARVMLSLTDPESGAPAQPRSPVAAPKGTGPLEAVGKAVSGALARPLGAASVAGRAATALAGEASATLARPAHALELARGVADDTRALAKLVLLPPERSGGLRGELAVARTVAWSRPFSLARVKSIARAQDATVNDVLLAALAGALRNHLLEHDEEPHAVRSMVPFNLRSLDQPVPRELGNHFGLVFLELPTDRVDRRERLRLLKRRMDAIKSSPEGPVSYAVLEAVGLAPAALESEVVDIFSSKASAVTTNVPGPRETVTLAGVPLRSVLVWAPTAGSIGMSVSIFSYRGEVTVGLLAHANLVPEPRAIVQALQSELAGLARLAPAHAA